MYNYYGVAVLREKSYNLSNYYISKETTIPVRGCSSFSFFLPFIHILLFGKLDVFRMSQSAPGYSGIYSEHRK